MTAVDRSRFPAGPWDREPDREEWRHLGLPCLAKRGSMGNWCGYVAVPPGHPSWGVDYNDVDVEVHGGLTYADLCDGAEGEGICHVPADGEPANVWWLGFDCAHGGDVIPSMPEFPGMPWGPPVYRDLAYVRSEVNFLAEQLAKVSR